MYNIMMTNGRRRNSPSHTFYCVKKFCLKMKKNEIPKHEAVESYCIQIQFICFFFFFLFFFIHVLQWDITDNEVSIVGSLHFFYSHTHKEYSTCMWRLQYMLGTRYAQYMVWDVTTVEWLNKRKSGPWHRNTCTAPLASAFTDRLRSPVCLKGSHGYWWRSQCTFASWHFVCLGIDWFWFWYWLCTQSLFSCMPLFT